MAEDDVGERSEEATQTRREDFRKRGQVVQTKELASALYLLLAVGIVFMMSRYFYQQIGDVFKFSLGPDLVSQIRNQDLFPALRLASEKAAMVILPVFGITFFIGLASTFLQVGFVQVEDAFSLNLNKINPWEGVKRVFSLRNLSEAVKSILKLVFISSILYFLFRKDMLVIPHLMQGNVEEILKYLGTAIGKLFGGIALTMIALAIADFLFLRWDLEKKMRMTKQEVKEENKSREGDPMIKARIRKIQKEMSNRRMMDKVPQADVIITNPTHIAVALKYDANLPAPQLIAKGADLMAEKIRNLAREHKIPIIENKPLARTIYKTMKLGQVIPRELFVAVAEVLSYVFKLKKKRKGAI